MVHRNAIFGRLWASALALGLVALPLAAAAQRSEVRHIPGVQELTGEVIVRVWSPAEGARLFGGAIAVQARRARGLARIRPHLLRRHAEVDHLVIQVPSGWSDARFVQRLRLTGDYAFVEPNYRVFPTRQPNDQFFSNQWHHHHINTNGAWNMSTGDSRLVVALVDTGIDVTHPDLIDNRVQGYNAVDQIPEWLGGQVDDLNGHGTHTAGCVGATTNNRTGVAGMGWSFRLMPIRVANHSSGGSTIEIITRGARWAVENGAKIISSSYSGVASFAVGDTGRYIRERGGLYFYAAGNTRSQLPDFDHPFVTVVAATDRNDQRPSFSSWGRGVDICAPGVDILSTVPGPGYEAWSGTSFATPLAAGLAGLVWSANPRMNADEVERLLFRTAKDIGAPGDDDVHGWGRIDAFNAVRIAMMQIRP
jgi:subtilisin family serine protease